MHLMTYDDIPETVALLKAIPEFDTSHITVSQKKKCCKIKREEHI
ncbi:hypothetical protein [Ureibacillus acetophenoni]